MSANNRYSSVVFARAGTILFVVITVLAVALSSVITDNVEDEAVRRAGAAVDGRRPEACGGWADFVDLRYHSIGAPVGWTSGTIRRSQACNHNPPSGGEATRSGSRLAPKATATTSPAPSHRRRKSK